MVRPDEELQLLFLFVQPVPSLRDEQADESSASEGEGATAP